MVVRLPSKQKVEGSIPFSRSIFPHKHSLNGSIGVIPFEHCRVLIRSIHPHFVAVVSLTGIPGRGFDPLLPLHSSYVKLLDIGET
ncbi:MAG: hypothetical protein JWQ35_1391 [Bacteriovoracaceae bacterium]|nr:hypothetical protein [Bacteriovoracaceae bacterium]